MGTEIKYNGSVIASVPAGKTGTIICAGKLMTTNVEVVAAESPTLSVYDDGAGNVTIEGTAIAAIDNGDGNVTIEM